jgi:hypothetical protein
MLDRLIQHRKIYLFHRARVHYYPVDGADSDGRTNA